MITALVLAAITMLPRHGVFGAALDQGPGGVRVTRVIPQSPAAAAGVSAGDVLTAIGNARTPGVAAFLWQIHQHHAGERVTIALLRHGARQHVDVVLAAPASENDPALVTEYGALKIDGSLRRTLLTYPKNASGKLPAVLLLGGIGCYSVDVAANPQDGYMRLMQDISRAGFVTMRLEKSGVGDSQGPPCPTVDFASEEHSYAVALGALRSDPRVDASRVFLLGHSIGSLEAPRLALAQPVAGVIASEAVGRDWAEYEIRNLRRQLEAGGDSPAQTDTALTEKAQCLVHLLYDKQPEAQIERTMPDCKDANSVYPVDPPYMQQVAAVNVIDAWTKLNVPVLAIYGTADIVTEAADHQRIVDVVNKHHPQAGTFVSVEGMDHYLQMSGHAYDTQLSTVVIDWLRKHV